MSSGNLFEVKNLSAGYSGKTVVSGINICVGEGGFVGIIGPNGAGKSTLIKAVSRALKPSAGSVFYNGRDLLAMPLAEVARLIAVVPQETLIDFEFLARDIVMMGRIPYIKRFGRETPGDFEAVDRAMRLADVTAIADRLITELSAGERQRVFIAKALAQEPGLLIMDEPTSHLDISHQVEVLELVKGLSRSKRLAALAVLHDLRLAAFYCDRLLLVHEGLMHAYGKPSEVLKREILEKVYKTSRLDMFLL